jgi:hypothetical protein
MNSGYAEHLILVGVLNKSIGKVSLNDVFEWLLKGEPLVEYNTRVDLLGQLDNEPTVILSKKKMIEDQKINLILRELKDWQKTVLSNHKNASHPLHKLTFIADIGLKKEDPEIDTIIENIFDHKSEEGPFQVSVNVPKHFGGSGNSEWAWSLCDAPIIVYSLAKFGLDKDEQVQKAVRYLVGLVHENGWHCGVSKELGKFRGPGRKDDPCPYANLVMLKMLSQFDEWKNSKEARVGAEILLSLWQKSLDLHPYLFYMGTDFRKIKAPLVWYDILHVLDVLSQFNWLKDDPRLTEMSNLLKSKADSEGKYTPESEWQAWKGWDFGQKKQPSRWLTFLVMRVLKRIN